MGVEKSKIMYIAFATDNNYAIPASTAIASILINSASEDRFHFYILDDKISAGNKEVFGKLQNIKKHKLDFIPVDNKNFQGFPLWAGGVTSYYRYMLPELLPNVQKILYLDSDTFVRSSLNELWKTDLSDSYGAAVEGFCATCPSLVTEKKDLDVSPYFNAGVLLLNLKKLREENVLQKLHDNTLFLKSKNLLRWRDQSVLNYTFKNKVKWLDKKYNVQLHVPEYKEIRQPVILHYIDRRPWQRTNLPFWNEYNQVAQKVKALQ